MTTLPSVQLDTAELLSGERQVADDLDQIRADHTSRYTWAADVLDGAQRVVDAACGVGYGSAVLADAGMEVLAIDRSPSAVLYGRERWHREGIDWRTGDVTDVPQDPADAVVCFETLEHLADPAPALERFRAIAPRLLVSVPNEAVFPFRNYRFHHRHYTAGQLERLLARCGWQVDEWWGQLGPHSPPERNVNGRTLIAVCSHRTRPMIEPKPEGPAVAMPQHGPHPPDDTTGEAVPHPILDSVARRVAIVAMGRSSADFTRGMAAHGGYPVLVDEVWAINAMGGVVLHQRLFHMDDVRVQEARVAAMDAGEYQRNVPVWGTMQWLKSHPGPVFTSREHPDYPGMYGIPAQDIMRAMDCAYFNSTVAWAIGYAGLMHKRWGKLEELHMYGCDFSYPQNRHGAEAGRACVEFLLGRLVERGVRVVLPQSTTLFDAVEPLSTRVYGFDTERISVQSSADGLVFDREPLPEDEWPTAQDIELRYRPGTELKPQNTEPKPEAPAAPRLVTESTPDDEEPTT